MRATRRTHPILARALALCGLLPLAVGCASRPAGPTSGRTSVPVLRTPSPSLVDLRCERVSSEAVRVEIRNRTARPREVRLQEMRYAGRSAMLGGQWISPPGGIWDRGWTQEGINLPARGTWSAVVYEGRMEKLEVRDRADRLLAELNLMQNLPRLPEPIIVALHSRADWHPLGPPDRRTAWSTMVPSGAKLSRADIHISRTLVVGDVRPESLTEQQREELRRRVESGGTLILCGGPDLSRLRAWERAGLVAAPVRGTRAVAGLRSLAQRYGTPALISPVPVADVGPVASTARVLLEEHGVPLAVERPLGLGTLVLTTFDPTRPPFRGSPLEPAFWQEWLLRSQDEFTSLTARMDEAAGYRQVRRDVHLVPPAVTMIAALGLVYLVVLVLAVWVSQRRARAVIAISLLGSAAALALGPVLRSRGPVAGFAGLLYLSSGDSRGWWWGQAEVMAPQRGLVTLRVPNGGPFMWWDSPRLRLAGTSSIIVQPVMRHWIPRTVLVRGPVPIPGSIMYDVELQDDGIVAAVQNRTPYPLRDVEVIWNRWALVRLGDLPPGGQVRRLLARIGQDGQLRGIRETPFAVYGPSTGFGNSPDAYLTPLLLAHCPPAPLPELLANEQPVHSVGHTALLIRPSAFRLRGAFHLPTEASPTRLGRAERSDRLWMWGPAGASGKLLLQSDGWAALELRLPSGAGSARWRTLALQIDTDRSMSATVEAFDWPQQRWVRMAVLPGDLSFPPPAQDPRRRIVPLGQVPTRTRAITLPSPERFVNRYTDTLLVRVKNVSSFPATVEVAVRGRGVAR